MSELSFDLHSAMPMGMLKKLLAESGVTDAKLVADAMERLKRLQIDAGIFYSYDGFTEHGSSTHARISDGRQDRDCIMWSINHYLGLNRHPDVISAVQQEVGEYGTGCGTSAMSGGFCTLHKQLETRLAQFVGKERVLLFPTGFTANSGAIAGLASKRDLILSDAENHASIIEGCRSSRAQVLAFAHNDVKDLEKNLQRYRSEFENVFVVVESAYSMSGDLAPLREIAALKERYNFLFYVDEAHTFGFFGRGGRGYCDELGVTAQVDFIMSTLSKATASIGGFVATDSKYCTMLTWNARPYLFQACLSPGDAAAVLGALDVIEREPSIIANLHENNRYFRELLRREGFNLGKSQSPIVPVFIEDYEKLFKVTSELFEQGIFSVAVTYPAVGAKEGRLRFIVSAAHTREDIERTVKALCQACRKYEVMV